MKTVVGVLCVLYSLQVGAQSADRFDHPRYDRKTARAADPQLAGLYMALSELSLAEQRHQMWGLSSATKVELWRHNIERYLQKHPELEPDSRNVLLEGIALISTPAWFDIQEGSIGYQAKVQALQEHKRRIQAQLQPEAIVEIFIRLGPEPIPEQPRRPGAIALGDGGECTCASWYDCPLWPAQNCYDSYCIPLQRCGSTMMRSALANASGVRTTNFD
jgi:hypothetical protein